MTKEEKFKILERFFIENRESHYRLAYSYVKNKESALDIIQESIVKALNRIDQLHEISFLKTWFYRILINTSIDFIRKHQRVTVMESDTIDAFLPKLEDKLVDLDLQDAIDQLPPQYKTLIILRFFEDLKITEVAEIVNLNVNTTKTRLYRALQILRLEIEGEI